MGISVLLRLFISISLQHCLRLIAYTWAEKVREKTRECHNHKPQPFPDPKRKKKPTNLNKHKPNKRTKSTKISSLFPKRGNRNTKRTEKHKNKLTQGKTYNKSPRRINDKATKSKTNTGTTALERSVEQTTAGFKALLQLANFTLGRTPFSNIPQWAQWSQRKWNITCTMVKWGDALRPPRGTKTSFSLIDGWQTV